MLLIASILPCTYFPPCTAVLDILTSYIVFPHVDFLWADVVCKYWPWALQKNRQVSKFDHSMQLKPCLSVMHGNAHSSHCQVSAGSHSQATCDHVVVYTQQHELDLVGRENAGRVCRKYWRGNGAAIQLYVPSQSDNEEDDCCRYVSNTSNCCVTGNKISWVSQEERSISLRQ